MPEPLQISKLNPILRWPHWPWPPGDPGPDPIWESILSGLDKTAVNQLAKVQLEVVKATLQAQLNAVQHVQEILGKAAGR